MNISRKRRLRSLKGCYLVFTGFHSIFVHTSRLERKLSWQRCTMSLPSFYWVSVGLAFTWQRGIVSWKAFYRVFPSFLFTKKNREPIGRWDGCTNHRFNTLTKQNNRKTKQNKRNRRRINRNNEVSAGAFQCNTHSRRKKFDEKKKQTKKQNQQNQRRGQRKRREVKTKIKERKKRDGSSSNREQWPINSPRIIEIDRNSNSDRDRGPWTARCPVALFFSFLFFYIYFFIFLFFAFFFGWGVFLHFDSFSFFFAWWEKLWFFK